MRFLHDNGLTAALLFSLAGMMLAGWADENTELAQHAQPLIGFVSYVVSGSFLSALFENWESEFLQMTAYVIFTAYLFQRGSAELPHRSSLLVRILPELAV
jgi:ABC-type sugar transport system substrate-binding protein